MIKRKGYDQVCHIQKKSYKEDEIVYITFPGLEKTGCVKHLFSTRIGGVSRGMFSSMNLSYTRGDEKEAVDENYRRIAACLESDVSCFVCSDQTHTDNIRIVGPQDMGKGTIYPKDYHDVDGLITDQRGIVLGTFFADCVPLFFVDPVKKAIGMTHSGWRGTVQKIGKKTVRMMQEQYGSNPADMYTAIGPSICQSCYEVSGDVIDRVKEAFPEPSARTLLKEKPSIGSLPAGRRRRVWCCCIMTGSCPWRPAAGWLFMAWAPGIPSWEAPAPAA